MKKIFLFLVLILTACSAVDSLSEFGVDNKDCIGIRRFKILQVIYQGGALAYECHSADCEGYFHNNLDFILDINTDFYDNMIYEVPSDKCAIRSGVYRYQAKDKNIKTVSQVMFTYKNYPKTEEEHQRRVYEAKEVIYDICMESYKENKLKTDEKYCRCYSNSFLENNGNTETIKNECGKIPDFLQFK